MTRPRTARVCPPPHRTSPEAPRAFTLIELLVVIAIIAILIGLLVPGLGRAMYLSRETKCSSNLKQIAMGWSMYLDDKRFFPKGVQFDWGGVDWYLAEYNPNAPDSSIVSPGRPVNPFIGSDIREQSRAEVFQCPLDDGFHYNVSGEPVTYPFAQQSAAEDVRHTIFGQIGTSYRANEWMWTIVGKRGWITPPDYEQTEYNTPAMAVDPSRFVLVGDLGSFLAGRISRAGRDIAPNGFALSWWHGYEVCTFAMLDGSSRRYTMTPGTAATRDYFFYLNPFKQPGASRVYASSNTGTPPAPTHPYAYDHQY